MRNKNLAQLSLSALLSISIALLITIPSAFAKKHALLIGISDYQYVGKLASAVRDAKKMEAFFLEDLGIKKANIQHLYNQQATHDNIMAAFKRLYHDVKKNDQVFVYYSGHGSQIPDTNGDEKDKWDETLVSIDARDKNGTGVFSNMVIDDELDDAFKRIEDKGVNTVMITDACHSGSITRSIVGTKNIGLPITARKDLRPVLRSNNYQQRRKEKPFLTAAPRRVEWSAVSAGQLAYESVPIAGGGVFTRYFLDGLKHKKADKNADGIISNSELLHYVQQKSKAFCEYSYDCKEEGYHLTPTLSIAENRYGEAVFPQIMTANVTINTATNSLSQREKVLHMLEQTLPLNKPKQLSMSIVNGDKLTLGQNVFVKIKSQKKGYLILLDLNAKGQLVQNFPNRYHKENVIKADEDFYVPEYPLQAYAITATDIGKSHLYAIVTHDKIDLSDVVTRNKDLTSVAKPTFYANAIAERLNAVWQGELTNRVSDYSVARFDYQVREVDK